MKTIRVLNQLSSLYMVLSLVAAVTLSMLCVPKVAARQIIVDDWGLFSSSDTPGSIPGPTTPSSDDGAVPGPTHTSSEPSTPTPVTPTPNAPPSTNIPAVTSLTPHPSAPRSVQPSTAKPALVTTPVPVEEEKKPTEVTSTEFRKDLVLAAVEIPKTPSNWAGASKNNHLHVNNRATNIAVTFLGFCMLVTWLFWKARKSTQKPAVPSRISQLVVPPLSLISPGDWAEIEPELDSSHDIDIQWATI